MAVSKLDVDIDIAVSRGIEVVKSINRSTKNALHLCNGLLNSIRSGTAEHV